MNKLGKIHDFLGQPEIAVVGVSSNPKKFGTVCYNNLQSKGYQVIPVNSNLEYFNGEKCYRSIKDIPSVPKSILLVIPPAETLKVVQEASEIGVKHVWMQLGSENQKAINFCKQNGMEVISRECILMFVEPVNSIHKFHRFVNKLVKIYPQ